MKFNEKALANTLGFLGALYYLVCYLIVLIFPNFYRAIAQSWFHGMDLNLVWKGAPGGLITGVVSFTAVSWFSGWLFAVLYNRFLAK